LRLGPEICAALRRLGFKTIGSVLHQPRAPFAARFPAKLLRRLDQAAGRLDEPLAPVALPPVYHSIRYLLEPLLTQEAVVALATRLMQTLAHVLERDAAGARALRLSLYRVDGELKSIDIALTLPTRSVAHVARLIALKLEALSVMEDAGFGFEAVGLAVTGAEPMPPRQNNLHLSPHPGARAEQAAQNDAPSAASFAGRLRWPPQDEANAERCAALIDALRQRLGADSVRRFEAVASHIPERAEVLATIVVDDMQSPPPGRRRSNAQRSGGGLFNDLSPDRMTRSDPPLSGEGEPKHRPLLLLPRAEPAEVTALVPEGPPRRFCWRGRSYEVASAEGPERIAAEWWRNPGALTRDYFLVEAAGGARFWLFREGLYGRETTVARWFVHGLFA